jgi:cellulose synthase/poly-beta-1,6-N-acetylglucosamine synthase-like glycosyltransferase
MTASATAPELAVIIPSFRRPDGLRRCLASLDAQTLRPAEIVVGVREGDAPTLAVITACAARGLPVRGVTTRTPGVIAAMTAALSGVGSACTITALLDDDATAWPDYCARIVAAFGAEARLGGFGGRDWQPRERGTAAPVGIVQWFGRVIGNHHLGAGAARAVDLLKGACCAYRTAPLRDVGFGTHLRGVGSQWGWELRVGLAMQARGWRLVYDPALGVDHHIEPRQVDDQYHRGIFKADELIVAASNETAILLEFLPWWRRAAFLLWAVLVGTRMLPGFLQLPRLLLLGEGLRWREFAATMRGRFDGCVAARSAA